jgi:asparagine synthase (glutamine-hydrolysing)
MDESILTRRLTSEWGMQYDEFLVDQSTYRVFEDEMFAAMDQPQVDMFETFLISKLASTGIRVALSGAGGDEAFHGYLRRPWLMQRLHILSLLTPQVLLRSIRKLRHPFLASVADLLMSARPDDVLGRYVREYGLSDGRKRELFHGRIVSSTEGLIADSLSGPWKERIEGLTGFFVRQYLPGHILAVADMAGMYHPLEIRVPFLDTELFQWGLSLPHEYSFAAGTTKRLVREAMRGRLPDYILNAPKRGFGTPRQEFLKASENDVRAVIGDPSGLCRTLFSAGALERIVDDWYDDPRERRPWGHFLQLASLYTLNRWFAAQQHRISPLQEASPRR